MKNNHSPAAEYNRIMWARLQKRMKKDEANTTFEEKVSYLEMDERQRAAYRREIKSDTVSGLEYIDD